VLAPATVPPVSAECVEQLTYFEDGNISPVTCPNGGVNVLAWRALTDPGPNGDDAIFTLGPYATPDQVLTATCAYYLHDETIPIVTSAEGIAAAYYGWKISVSISDELVLGGCGPGTE